MKVLFIDIDGVLNNGDLLDLIGWDAIGDVFINRLKRIIEETEAKIVLSSTWRLRDETKTKVEEALATRGLSLLDRTIELRPTKLSGRVERVDEILEWLSRHDVDKFAILDDCSDAGYGLPKNFFQTDFETGLTEEITEKVIEWLQ